MSKVVTANLLATGAVVFAGGDGAWVGELSRAQVFTDDASAEAALVRAKADERAMIVDPFIAPLEAAAGGPPRMSLRDSIRAFGPTVRYGAKAGEAKAGDAKAGDVKAGTK